MLREQNIKNLKTEKEGIIILKSLLDTFIVTTKDQIKTLYNILNIDYKKYTRSVDGVVIHVASHRRLVGGGWKWEYCRQKHLAKVVN